MVFREMSTLQHKNLNNFFIISMLHRDTDFCFI